MPTGTMPRFNDRAREELLEEYTRLKAQNVSDAQIARRFGVSQMTILRWKQRYKLNERTADISPFNVGDPGEVVPQVRPTDVASSQSSFAASPASDAALRQEVVWLRELASRLLLENERLRAELDGRLGQRLRPE